MYHLDQQVPCLLSWQTLKIDYASHRFTILNAALQAVTSNQLMLAHEVKPFYHLCKSDLGEMKW